MFLSFHLVHPTEVSLILRLVMSGSQNSNIIFFHNYIKGKKKWQGEKEQKNKQNSPPISLSFFHQAKTFPRILQARNGQNWVTQPVLGTWYSWSILCPSGTWCFYHGKQALLRKKAWVELFRPGSPNHHPTLPWPVRNWVPQQKVSIRRGSEASSIFTATPHHLNYPLSSGKQAQGPYWFCIVVSYKIISLYIIV